MKSIILLFFLLGCQSFHSVKIKESECTVFGHGPYDLDRTECIKLAERQAYTNCALHGRDSEVEFISRVFDKDPPETSAGSCFSSYNSATGDCRKSRCQDDRKSAISQ